MSTASIGTYSSPSICLSSEDENFPNEPNIPRKPLQMAVPKRTMRRWAVAEDKASRFIGVHRYGFPRISPCHKPERAMKTSREGIVFTNWGGFVGSSDRITFRRRRENQKFSSNNGDGGKCNFAVLPT